MFPTNTSTSFFLGFLPTDGVSSDFFPDCSVTKIHSYIIFFCLIPIIHYRTLVSGIAIDVDYSTYAWKLRFDAISNLFWLEVS